MIGILRNRRKQDKNSVHNMIEVYLASNGLDMGNAFGGKCNGKDARKALEQSTYVSEDLRGILQASKNTEYIDTDIDGLLIDQVLRQWQTGIHSFLFCSRKRQQKKIRVEHRM